MDQGHNRAGGLADLFSNRPLITGLLFLGTYFAPFLILIGLPLAYVFKRRPEEDWEPSHFQYLIRTIWNSLLFLLFAALLAVAVTALFAWLDVDFPDDTMATLVLGFYAVAVGAIALAYSGVRIIISLMKSATRTTLTKPNAWFI